MAQSVHTPLDAAPRAAQSRTALDLLVMNLAMDVSHTALGFTSAWVNALARRCRSVSVITMSRGELDTEPNVTVRSIGNERGWSRPRRLAEFYRLTSETLRERPIDACFVHMAPLFAALFGPVAKVRGIPILLWYAHGAVSPTLRVAHAFADRCVTSTPAGFRLPSDKLYAVGQGVDTEVFQPPGEELPDYDQTLISIGRLSRTKRIDEILAAMALLRDRGCDARLELTGEPLTEADREHVRDLEEQVDRLGLAATVRFTGRVRFDEVPARYHRGGVFINMSENRSIDKAILEAMASGCVPLSRNEAFGEIAAAHEIDELVPGPGPADIADAVERELSRPADDREWLRAQLRSIVVDGHSLDALADRLVGHLVELTR